jgi:tRNA nucleotidyltransferase/poly(A) polymerase
MLACPWLMWYGSSMTYAQRIDTFMAGFNFETYRVGGSVRDEILGRRIKDCDYMVRGVTLKDLGDALRAKSHAANYKVAQLKLRDGRVAGYRISGQGLGCIEIVLPRKEVSTGPGHRDFKIVMDPKLSLAEDAERRDFTFNALYLRVDRSSFPDLDGKDLFDPTGSGLDDLQRRRISITHRDSFRDDPLRTLRALRFVSTLGYELAPSTYWLMREHAQHVTGLTAAGVSGTVLEELGKMLMGDYPADALRLARDTGVLQHVLPELRPMLGFDQGSRYHDLTTDEHTFAALERAAHVGAPLRVRMALLFHDSGKPEAAWVGKDGRKHYYSPSDKDWADSLLADGMLHQGSTELPVKPEDHEIAGARIWRKAARRLNAGKGLRDDVDKLIRNHMVSTQKANPVKVRRERVRLGDDLLRDLYMMRACDLCGKGTPNAKQLEVIADLEHFRVTAQAAAVPVSVKDLRINGHDLMAAGVNGRDIGRALNGVLDEVVCQPEGVRLTPEWQYERALRLATS